MMVERGTRNEERKITSFYDLDAWRSAHELALFVYKLTRNFPKDEIYGLISQLRRAAVSVTSNIAEGFVRDTYADKARFYVMAHASIAETSSQMFLARDLGYISTDQFAEFSTKSETSHKILRGLIRSTKDKK